MAKNYVETGDRVVVTAPEAADSGEFLVVGALAGVAVDAALNGADVVLKRTGVWELPKAVSGTAWTQGMRLYWDASAKKFTTVAAGNRPMGVAWEAALDAATTGLVLLTPELTGLRTVLVETALDGTNPTPVTTGLSVVLAANAGLKGTAAPGDNTSVVTVDYTGSDGTVNVYGWKNTSGSDPTLVASTGTETVIVTAYGY